MYMSKRNFLTITGTYKGVPVSVVAICMVSNKKKLFTFNRSTLYF